MRENSCVFGLIAILTVMTYSQTPRDDEVHIAIPQYSDSFFSGFLQLSDPAKHINYEFFPSLSNPKSDPVLILFASEPGESVLLTWYHEIGPFIMHYGKTTFDYNPYHWNLQANVLFFDLPAGVGFSEGMPQSSVRQETFTKDAIEAIKLFYNRFPQYSLNDVYFTSRGYGAIHITYLAKSILEQNSQASTIRLKGLLLGNPCTKPDECYVSGSGRFSHYHYEFLNSKYFFTEASWKRYSEKCKSDTYDFYGCYIERKGLDIEFQEANMSLLNIDNKCNRYMNEYFNYPNPTCEDYSGLVHYFNDWSIKLKYHLKQSQYWDPFNKKIYEQYLGEWTSSSYWIYPQLIENHLRIWVYSGEEDSYVPTIGTKQWVDQLKNELSIPVKQDWKEWRVPQKRSLTEDDEAAGTVLELRDLTLLTVRGGGFKTAEDKPEAMLHILNAFLASKSVVKA